MKKSELVKCPTCGRSISQNAAACPGCAEPVIPVRTNTAGINLKDPVHVLGIFVSVLIVIGTILFVIDRINQAKADRRREVKMISVNNGILKAERLMKETDDILNRR